MSPIYDAILFTALLVLALALFARWSVKVLDRYHDDLDKREAVELLDAANAEFEMRIRLKERSLK